MRIDDTVAGFIASIALLFLVGNIVSNSMLAALLYMTLMVIGYTSIKPDFYKYIVGIAVSWIFMFLVSTFELMSVGVLI